MDKITDNNYGATGGYLLIAPQHNIIVSARDRNRMLQAFQAPGMNRLHDNFMSGFEGYGVASSFGGIEELSAAKGIPAAGWILVAALHPAEAFAPIDGVRQRLLVGVLIFTLLASFLIWRIVARMMQSQIVPMLAATRAFDGVNDTSKLPPPLPVTSDDEIGELIGGFNRLLDTLAHRESALRESYQVLPNILEANPDGYWRLDGDGKLLDVNSTYCRQSGYSREELLGKHIADFDAGQSPRAVAKHIEGVIAGGSAQFESRHRRKDGSVWPVEVSVSYLDKGGQRFYVFIRDITQRKQMEEHVYSLAFYDPLTKLPNRRLFADRLQQSRVATARSGCYGALLFLDLDNFKAINDAHGHGVGDLLLIEVTDRLKNCIREIDTVARFGGDEFVVVINELHVSREESAIQARLIAEKIRTALAAPYWLSPQDSSTADRTIEYCCTTSIGGALFLGHEANQADILKWADAAMYSAKSAGRNAIKFHDDSAGTQEHLPLPSR